MKDIAKQLPPLATAKYDAFPITRYLRINQIVGPNGLLPISRSGFWAGVKSGRFPKPRKISARVTVWLAEDIQELMTRINEGQV